MRTGDNRVASVMELYHQELAPLHAPGELKAILRTVFQERLGWDALDLETRREHALSESELLQVYLPLKRLRNGEPLQYVLGSSQFHGMRLEVAPGVLIPRPETEELIELILASRPDPRTIIDIGTGSGCIALALKKEFPQSRVIGIDISTEALRIASRNGDRLNLKVEWQKADVLQESLSLSAHADLIVSNPPYVPQTESPSLTAQVRDHEPHVALFVPDDDPLLFYRRITELALRSLDTGGMLWFEGHFEHSSAVADLLRTSGFIDVQLHKDLSGNHRFIEGRR